MTRPIAGADPVTQPFWDATAAEVLLLQRCAECDVHQHYPRPLCAACGSTELEFVQASGRGVVHSFTVVHRAPHEAFTPPYVVAIVRLDEGPSMLTNIVGCETSGVACDMRVRVGWEPLEDGRKLPVFSPEA